MATTTKQYEEKLMEEGHMNEVWEDEAQPSSGPFLVGSYILLNSPPEIGCDNIVNFSLSGKLIQDSVSTVFIVDPSHRQPVYQTSGLPEKKQVVDINYIVQFRHSEQSLPWSAGNFSYWKTIWKPSGSPLSRRWPRTSPAIRSF